MTLNCIRWWGTRPRASVNVAYPFIAMTYMSTLTHVVLYVTFRSGQTNDDTIRRATRSFRKIYLSLYLKGLCVRGSWRPNRTATYWPPLLWPSAFLSCSPGLLNRRPGGRSLLGVGCWLSLPYLVSKLVWSPNSIGGPAGLFCRVLFFSTASSLQTDWISCALSYIIVQRPLSLLCTSAIFGMACLIVIQRK